MSNDSSRFEFQTIKNKGVDIHILKIDPLLVRIQTDNPYPFSDTFENGPQRYPYIRADVGQLF